MGIDYSGGMIVGASGGDIEVPDDYEGSLGEWTEENEMDSMSEYYDAPEESTYYGFEVPDILVEVIDGDWLADVKSKAKKFEELTGVKATLIGTQNIF